MGIREFIENELNALFKLLQRVVYEFVRCLGTNWDGDSFNGLLASEAVFARDWDTPEEDAAWQSL